MNKENFINNIRDVSKIREEIVDSQLSPFSICSSINKLDNAQDGYLTDIAVKGRTLVNLFDKGDVWVSGIDNGDTIKQMSTGESKYLEVALSKNLKPSTEYTLIIPIIDNTDNNTTVILTDNPNKIFEEKSFGKGIKGSLVAKVRTLGSFTSTPRVGLKFSELNGTITASKNWMILEGDHTKNPPSYFEGVKSVGELENNKIEILSIYKNLYRADTAKLSGSGIYTISDNYYMPNEVYIINNAYQKVNFEIWNKDTNQRSREIGIIGDSYQKIYLNNEYVRTATGLFEDGWNERDLEYFSDNIMVTGSLDIKQEPYKEDKSEILLKEPLREWDLIKSDGTVKRNTSQIVLSGIEDLSLDKLINSVTRFSLKVDGAKKYNSPSLVATKNDKLADITENESNTEITGVALHYDGTLTVNIENKTLGIIDLDTDDIKINKFKSWLSKENLTIVYKSETRTIEQNNKSLVIRSFKDGYIQQNMIIPSIIEGKHSTNLGERIVSIMDFNKKINDELWGVWKAILNLADTELAHTGNIDNLKTIDKSNLVNAINEVLINDKLNRTSLELTGAIKGTIQKVVTTDGEITGVKHIKIKDGQEVIVREDKFEEDESNIIETRILASGEKITYIYDKNTMEIEVV